MKSKEAMKVFRDPIEEERNDYTVAYQPADARSPIAILSLHFEQDPVDVLAAAKAMEREMERWLKKYPVPVKVSAFDAMGNLVRHSPHPAECHLTGYVRLWDSSIIRRWALLPAREIPDEVMEPKHLERCYKNVSFRMRREDEECLQREAVARWTTIGSSLLLILLVPLLVFMVRSGGQAVALSLTVFSIGIGGYMLAGAMGWRKLRGGEHRRAERLRLLEHYLYHCEANPEAFARLKQENLEHEATEQEEKVTARSRRTGKQKAGLARRVATAARAFRTAT